ncbi:MAG: multidrug ABC transporter permease [Hadesarchaea archaeon DG-33]|nr:MAG: multidrug ABC transporter permease [Hadesarchaea archaeon DG-33]
MKWFLRAKARIISTIVMPFLWLAILGMGLGAVTQIPGVGNYIDFLAPGIVAMAILFNATMTGVSVLWDRQFGFLKEILVAPVSRISIMLGRTFGGTTTSIIQGVMLLLVAGLIGAKMPGPAGFLLALLFMIVLAIGFVGLGLAIASRITDPVAFPLVINFLIMPLFFLSGAIFPLGMAPEWLRVIAYIDPVAYGVDGLRGVIIGVSEFPIWLDLAILGIFSLAMVLLGAYLFKKMSV